MAPETSLSLPKCRTFDWGEVGILHAQYDIDSATDESNNSCGGYDLNFIFLHSYNDHVFVETRDNGLYLKLKHEIYGAPERIFINRFGQAFYECSSGCEKTVNDQFVYRLVDDILSCVDGALAYSDFAQVQANVKYLAEHGWEKGCEGILPPASVRHTKKIYPFGNRDYAVSCTEALTHKDPCDYIITKTGIIERVEEKQRERVKPEDEDGSIYTHLMLFLAFNNTNPTYFKLWELLKDATQAYPPLFPDWSVLDGI